MRVARLLRSTEGVGAESQGRVAGLWGRGVATLRAGEQVGQRQRGTNGAGTLIACEYMRSDDDGMAGIAQAGMAQAGMAQAGMAQAGVAQAGVAQVGSGAVGPGAHVARPGWRRVADGVPDEGDERTVSGTHAKVENVFILEPAPTKNLRELSDLKLRRMRLQRSRVPPWFRD